MGEKQNTVCVREIRQRLRGFAAALDIRYVECLDSTNTRLRVLAEEGAPHGTVLIAGAQTAGRGQGDHRFFSPAETGLYLSVLLRPRISPDRLGLIGALAAVSACRAVESLDPGKKPGIKWVNDLYLDGKKVGGILSESVLAPGKNEAEFVILGVGLNVYGPPGGFPPELRDRAGSILERPISGAHEILAASFLNDLFEGLETLSGPGLPSGYKDRSLVLGRFVLLRRPAETIKVRVLDIDDHCRLIVLREDSVIETLHTGPVELLP